MNYDPKIQKILDKYTCNIQSEPGGPPVIGICSHDIVVLVNEIDRLMKINSELNWQMTQLTGKVVGYISQSQSG